MNKYRVYVTVTERLYLDVLAEDEDEAWEMAEQADISEYTDTGGVQWETERPEFIEEKEEI